MSRDTIGDFLTVLRNGVMVAKPSVIVPHSKMKEQIAQLLKNEGFVRDVVVEKQGAVRSLKVVLKYVNGESVIHEITRKSTPSRRVYRAHNGIDPVIGGLGISILTTNKGILTQKQAKAQSVGGEIICTVW